MRLGRFTASVVLISSTLWGCSTVKEELKPSPLKTITAKLKFDFQWSRQTGKGQDARYERLQPAVKGRTIYTVDVRGKLSAMSLEDGHLLWSVPLKKEIGGGIGVFGDLGFVGTLDGHVLAFALDDGHVVWEAQTTSEVVSTPQSNGDVVIASSIDGRVFAFDHKTGELRWNYDHAAPILSLRTTATPLVQSNSVFVPFDNGQMLSFLPTNGQLQWSARIAQPKGKTELERLVDADTAPIEYGPYIYGAGYNGRLVAISRGSGRITWAQDLSTASNIIASDNTIVAVDVDSHVKAFDASNGNVLWENSDLHRRGLSAPGILGSVVVVVDKSGVMHGLSLADGSLIARRPIGGHGSLAQPITIDNTVYVYTLSGVLQAFTIELTEPHTLSGDASTGIKKGGISTQFTGAN